jgi:hypothetical protein
VADHGRQPVHELAGQGFLENDQFLYFINIATNTFYMLIPSFICVPMN